MIDSQVLRCPSRDIAKDCPRPVGVSESSDTLDVARKWLGDAECERRLSTVSSKAILDNTDYFGIFHEVLRFEGSSQVSLIPVGLWLVM